MSEQPKPIRTVGELVDELLKLNRNMIIAVPETRGGCGVEPRISEVGGVVWIMPQERTFESL